MTGPVAATAPATKNSQAQEETVSPPIPVGIVASSTTLKIRGLRNEPVKPMQACRPGSLLVAVWHFGDGAGKTDAVECAEQKSHPEAFGQEGVPKRGHSRERHAGEIDVLCRLTVSETDQEGDGAEVTEIVGAGDPAGCGLRQVPRVDEGRQQRRYCRQG